MYKNTTITHINNKPFRRVINMFFLLRLIEFILLSCLIVLITKKFLIKVIRKLANVFDLDSKVVGDITGFATSMPELISVLFTALEGMFITVIFNILSSNIINAVQYIISIYSNKNQRFLDNYALKSDIVMVIITIIIPLSSIIFKINLNIGFVPIFIMLFILFYIVNTNTHNLYLSHIKTKEIKEIEEERRWVKGKKKIAVKNTVFLIIIGIALFIVGELLGNVVKSLNEIFKFPEWIIGIALGFITSIPELITFIESQKQSQKIENNISGVVEATNNLLTSNIINLFVVLTIGIIITYVLQI